MKDLLILFAVKDSLEVRLGGAAIMCIVGVILIYTGRQNIKNEQAEESGKRRIVNNVLGQSNTYEGSKAVQIGWIRVVCGVCAILFGIVFLFVGPILAR